jgi:broad specificity phosphatase PhoE
VAIEVVFETHSITEDNEQGRATGWMPGRLSPQGRKLARELGQRRRADGIAAVFSSDLLRPYPGGESWRQAVARVARFLDDLPSRWDGQRVLVIGHMATRWALDHVLGGMPLEDLAAADFAWRPGWEYLLLK